MTDKQYEFTQDWFAPVAGTWEQLFAQLKPKKVLEIGSFEGRTAVWMAHVMGEGEVYCVDPIMPMVRPNGDEFKFDMHAVRERFKRNIACIEINTDCTVEWFPKTSAEVLPGLIDNERGTFDVVYVDGAHDAMNCLRDMVMGFELLRPGGLMIVDDYLLRLNDNPAQSPKLAIDAFTNVYREHMNMICASNAQAYIQKR